MKGVPDDAYTTQNLIKKRIKDDEVNRKRAEARVKDVMMAKRNRQNKEEIKDPEFFTKRYRRKQKSYAIYKRKKNAFVKKSTEKGSIFAIRIKQEETASKQESNLLNKLRLTKKHNARFYAPTVENLSKLKLCENFLVYGHPSKSVIDELIRNRGFMDDEGKKVAITDNSMVEDKLEKFDIICIEDIVQALVEGQNVDLLQKDFLHTFLLSRNKKMDFKYNKKDKLKAQGGRHGYVNTKQIDLIIRKYL